MKNLWPVIILLILVFSGFYVWIQKEPYDPYSIDEIDKMLAEDPPWIAEKKKQPKNTAKENITSVSKKTTGEETLATVSDNSKKPAIEASAEESFRPEEKPLLTDEEYDKLEYEAEEAEKLWKEKIVDMFKEELNLDSSTISKYEGMRQNYHSEKEKNVKEFNRKMVNKYGEKYLKNPSSDMEQYEDRIFDLYLEKLRGILGDEHYSRYLELKHNYNKILLKKQDPKKGLIEIDF
jgi:hypothetical protein